MPGSLSCCSQTCSCSPHRSAQPVELSVKTHARPKTFLPGIGGIAAGMVLALMPKCPFCLAAWLTVITGIGWSSSVVGTLRYGMLAAAMSVLAFALWIAIRQRMRQLSI